MSERSLDPGRRLPLLPISGPTPHVTDALRLRVFLMEIDRQADLFNRSFADALGAAVRDDRHEAWRHLQASVFAAIVLHRLMTNDQPGRAQPGWSREQSREAAEWRVRELRRSLRLPDPAHSPHWAIYQVADVRNSLEHIDERLDRAVRSPGVDSISDWYLSNGSLLLAPDDPATASGPLSGLRAFVFPAGLLFFGRAQLDLFDLDVEMINLRHNVGKAIEDEKPEFEGHLPYGGGVQINRLDDDHMAARWKSWKNARAGACEDFSGSVPAIPWELSKTNTE